MSEVDLLTVLVRVVGLVTALLGTAAAVPGAVWRLQGRAAAGIEAVKARLSRSRDSRNVTGQAHLRVNATASATGIVTKAGVPSVVERIEALEKRVTEMEGTVRETRDSLRTETEARKDADTRLAGDIEGLRTALYDLEKVSTEIDARALPLVVLGIVLTGIGDWLASITWLAGVAIVGGALASVYALIILARHRP